MSARDEAKARVLAKVNADKALPASERVLNMLLCTNSPQDAQALLDDIRAKAERDVRSSIAADFEQFGKQQSKLTWGEAALIAREGLCACRGGQKPCQSEGGAR